MAGALYVTTAPEALVACAVTATCASIVGAGLMASQLALLFADIDDFKRVNDNFGHDLGDRRIEPTRDRPPDFDVFVKRLRKRLLLDDRDPRFERELTNPLREHAGLSLGSAN